jgi:hypothetical protein
VGADSDTITIRQKALLLGIRQGLVFIVGAIEDFLGMERTWKSNKQRRDERNAA